MTTRPQSTTSAATGGAATVVLVTALGANGVTTAAGVASSVEIAAAWLRSPTGRAFLLDYGDREALREPVESFMDMLRVDQLGAHLDLLTNNDLL